MACLLCCLPELLAPGRSTLRRSIPVHPADLPCSVSQCKWPRARLAFRGALASGLSAVQAGGLFRADGSCCHCAD